MTKVSLFCASIRPYLWEPLLNSLKKNMIEYEVIMCGYIDKALADETVQKYPEFKYIQTGDIKPAQAYEIARRSCTGELIGWISDDCEFPQNALDQIYIKWNREGTQNGFNHILAIKTHDHECSNNNLNDQRFFARNLNTPQMAQIGFMSRDLLQYIGGIDRRYLYGKWDYDICMRVIANGGRVVKFEDIQIKIEHTSKNGEYTNDWSGVNEDSEIAENSWVIGGYKDFEKPIMVLNQSFSNELTWFYPISNREVTLQRLDKFEPYEEPISLNESQSYRGRWQ